MQNTEILDDWVKRISNEEWKDTTERLVKLSLQIPPMKDRILELVWLICTEDMRRLTKCTRKI